MTKDEFIQETALRLITAWANTSFTPENIASTAKQITDSVWNLFDEEKEELPAISAKATQDEDKVSVLANEIETLERLYVNEKNEKYGTSRFQVSGLNIRFLNVCYVEGIKTVDDLLACGRNRFLKIRNVGKLTVKFLDSALDNLYGIKTW